MRARAANDGRARKRRGRESGAHVLHLDLFSGIAGNMLLGALLAMLTSCASNVTVVNIDNGFGAAHVATLINRL